MNQVAAEIMNNGMPGPMARAAFEAMPFATWAPGNRRLSRYTRFVTNVNGQPHWDIMRRPDSQGGFWGSIRWLWDVKLRLGELDVWHPYASYDSKMGAWTPTPLDVSPTDLNLTVDEARSWIEHGQTPTRSNPLLITQLKLATIVALENWSLPGATVRSDVYFNASPEAPGNSTRPPAIGLGHELVHAYFGACGRQPGTYSSRELWKLVLYEFKCVGLGPWEDASISENAIRLDWPRAMGRYGATMDPQNLRTPLRRVMY